MRKAGGLAPLKRAGGGLAPIRGGALPTTVGGSARHESPSNSRTKKKTKKKRKKKSSVKSVDEEVTVEELPEPEAQTANSEEAVAEVMGSSVQALVISDSSEYDYKFSEDDAVIDDGLVADDKKHDGAKDDEQMGEHNSLSSKEGGIDGDVECQPTQSAENTLSHSNRLSRRSLTASSPQRDGGSTSARGPTTESKKWRQSEKVRQRDVVKNDVLLRLPMDVRTRLKQLTDSENASVSLADACLGDPGCVAVAERLKSQQCSVTSLDLRGNQIKSKGATALAAALQRNRRLRTLSLEWNSLGLFPEGMRSLASTFAQNGNQACHVTSLDLRNNRLTAGAGTALAGALKTNRTLVSLDLRWNSLGELGSKALAVAMEQNYTLTSMNISGNGASNATLHTIRRCCERNKGKNAQNAENTTQSGSTKQGISAGPSLSSSFAMQNMATTDSHTSKTLLDPESLEGATSIIQALEQALRLQRAEAKSIAERLETETLSHTRTREALATAEEDLKRNKQVIDKHAETLRLERDRAAKERAKAAADSQSRLHRMSEIQTEAERERYEAEAKVRSLNEELADLREQLRQSQQGFSDAKDRLSGLQRELTAAASREDKTRVEHQRALDDSRRLFEQSSIEIKANADARCKLAEGRRTALAEQVTRLQAEVEAMKAKSLRQEMAHSSALDAMQVRVHAEASSAQKSALEQLEAELSATAAARDAVLSSRETEQLEAKEATDRIKKQVETLTSILGETQSREKALAKELAELKAEIHGHASRVKELETENANAKAETTACKVQADAEVQARTKDIQIMKARHEINRAQWKKECDKRDKRISALEAALRDKDATRVKLMANAGALNYSLRKCFADAKYKLQEPTSPSPAQSSTASHPSPQSGIAQKLSESSGSPSSRNKSPSVIVARPYHSVREEEKDKEQEDKDREQYEKGSGDSNSDEIIVMDDDDSDSVYDLDDEDDQNTSVEF